VTDEIGELLREFPDFYVPLKVQISSKSFTIVEEHRPLLSAMRYLSISCRLWRGVCIASVVAFAVSI